MKHKSLNREEDIDSSLRVMTLALRDIAGARDCDYCDAPRDERPTPCPCPKCTAQDALRAAGDWRYLGSRPERQEFNWREEAMVRAWRKYVGDKELSQLLASGDERPMLPTARDWYVATSIIQWLGTNVGSCIATESKVFQLLGKPPEVCDAFSCHRGVDPVGDGRHCAEHAPPAVPR